MKRTITFGDEAKSQQRFELFQAAILNGGAAGQRGGIEILRREAKLLDAFDAISDPAGDEKPRRVRDGAQLVLEQADFDVLKKRMEEAPWAPAASRGVIDALDWLSAAATTE